MDPVGLARVACPLGIAGVLALTHPPLAAAENAPYLRVELWADRDDDDADGRPDGDQGALTPPTFVDLIALDGRLIGSSLQAVVGGDHARVVLAGGRPWPWGRPVPGPAWLQGVSPGRVELLASGPGTRIHMVVLVNGIDMEDGEGNVVDMARSHASLERLPPVRVEGPPDARYDDFDALRVLVIRPAEEAGLDGDREIKAESLNALGSPIDAMPRVALSRAPCAKPYDGVKCWASAPLRFVIDDVDRNHPLVADRSIKAEVGGAIVFRSGEHKAQMIRVLGPRASPAGPIGRLRASLRPFVIRVAPGGAPAIGSTDAGAIQALRAELGAASAIWGQCGVTFGDSKSLEVKVVDPPPPHIVAVGGDLGIPASGGDVRLRADGRMISVTTTLGESPGAVAWDLARAAERTGLVAVVSSNARVGAAAGPTFDVSLRHKDGSLASAEMAPDAPISTDATLTVRIGSVDLSDGLQHFTDMDAMAGTLEERTLLKSLDDGDPSTIEVVVVPLFAGGGRIGESFIGSDLSSIRNVVLLDRAGIRARKSSLTLAHELGHVLMDLPGHPDDYGIDMPTSLMDSDAADASPFGPRRITVAECARVVRQAGPNAHLPLLTDWPVGPIPYDAKR